MSSYVTIPTISVSLVEFANPTALSFDPVSDILWAGINSGTVIAYLGAQGVRGPNIRVGSNLSVKKVIAGDNYVHAADNANGCMGSWTKGGVGKWVFRWVCHTVIRHWLHRIQTFRRASHILQHSTILNSVCCVVDEPGAHFCQSNSRNCGPSGADIFATHSSRVVPIIPHLWIIGWICWCP